MNYRTNFLACSSARGIAPRTLEAKPDKRASATIRRIRSPAAHRTQSQELLRQANRKLAIAAASQDTAAHRAGWDYQTRISFNFVVSVEEKKGVGILSVPRRDRSAECHVDELIKSVESEDIASGRVPEAEFGHFGVSWSADFAGVDFTGGG